MRGETTMSTGYCRPIYDRNNQQGAFMATPTLRPDLQAVVTKIQSLRKLTETTGFFTHRTIGALLSRLPVDDLVAVSNALQLKPREMPQGR
jgi:hypothetical protein